MFKLNTVWVLNFLFEYRINRFSRSCYIVLHYHDVDYSDFQRNKGFGFSKSVQEIVLRHYVAIMVWTLQASTKPNKTVFKMITHGISGKNRWSRSYLKMKNINIVFPIVWKRLYKFVGKYTRLSKSVGWKELKIIFDSKMFVLSLETIISLVI